MPSPCRPDHDAPWLRMSDFVAEHMGLHFPRERLADLRRGLAGAAVEFKFDDVAACAEWLMSARPTRTQLEVLASHLTIGETYFFRDRQTFDVLASRVLPELIQARRGREQRLRVWSAGCCSGEEAYSLAILLHEVLPDLSNWHVTILATDINVRFIRKAIAGLYAEWSFRAAPSGFKERYFTRTEDGRYAIRPEMRRLVTFTHLNLVDDVYPSLATDTNAMDLIFCRNVLMYFTPAQVQRAVGNLHNALVDGGWLAVSASEASQASFAQFVALDSPGVILYQKPDAERGVGHVQWAPPEIATPAPDATSGPPEASLAGPPETRPPAESHPAPGPEALSLLARALANEGRLADALAWCDRWIAADKVVAGAHYLRAVVLLELGRLDEARGSLQRALYLDPDFVLAHFALGSLARTCDKCDEANRHFANALRLLGRLQPHDLVPESGGLAAGRLSETIRATSVPGGSR